MNVTEAMNVLNLSGTVTQAEIKKAYKIASIKYHPDRNLAGAEMMVVINAAYDHLKSLGDTVTMASDAHAYDYGNEFHQILNELIKLDGLNIEVCGNWIWVTGETKRHKDKLGRNSGIGLFYSGKKKAWYYRPEEYRSRNRLSMDMTEIRDKHGSQKIKSRQVFRVEGL
ncbi:J domain-containing protein [Photobacterium sp. R1]